MTTSTSPSRRTVVAGAAWAVPAIAYASQAPALAVSGECLNIPAINRWRLSDQDVNEKPFRFINNGRTMEAIIDWAWWFGNNRPAFGYGWASTQLTVEPGNRYTIDLGLQTCKGYNWPGPGSPETCETNPTTLEVLWTPTGGAAQTLFRGATQQIDGFPLYEPHENCVGQYPNRPKRWRAFKNETVTFEVPCGASRRGTLELKFTTYPHQRITSPGDPRRVSKTQFSNQNNDDWRVTPTIVSCERIANCK
ncbi:hypothetical protein BSZ39_03510 [Bowdeniella nasicola]|uniref:Uncharacterized protein n=1 Tax=Bowdeniella nasicola TaxID=208480 RepID=A0A1Q5Q411_9ACTO|nr:hypothetical protein [Bowdeniella nasicola]OKL54535.1 hypothetical protein BSZ39_03510 [Bowdeniella nasicola]